MEPSKDLVERLAKAWLAEAKRLRSRSLCDCGCGEAVSVARARYKPGHDAKLLRDYRDRIRQILQSK
jgi:hypothetical protein